MKDNEKAIKIKGRHDSFAWSLKPLTCIMILFGIRLDLLTPMRLVSKLAIQVFGILLTLINFIDCAFQLIFYAGIVSEKVVDHVAKFKFVFSQDSGDNYARKILMDMFTAIMHYLVVFAVPTMFINHLFLTGQWKKLWLTLFKIQEEMDLSSRFYRKCRSGCYLAIGFFFLVKTDKPYAANDNKELFCFNLPYSYWFLLSMVFLLIRRGTKDTIEFSFWIY